MTHFIYFSVALSNKIRFWLLLRVPVDKPKGRQVVAAALIVSNTQTYLLQIQKTTPQGWNKHTVHVSAKGKVSVGSLSRSKDGLKRLSRDYKAGYSVSF